MLSDDPQISNGLSEIFPQKEKIPRRGIVWTTY